MFASISNLFGAAGDADAENRESPKLCPRTLRPSESEERRTSSRSCSSAESQRLGGAGLLAKPISDQCDNEDDNSSEFKPSKPRFVRQDSADGDTNWRQGSRSSFCRQTSMRIPTPEGRGVSFQHSSSERELSRSKSSGRELNRTKSTGSILGSVRELDRTKSTGSILGAAPPSILGCGDEVSKRSILGCGQEASESILAEAKAATNGLLGEAPPSHQNSFKRMESTGSILGASPHPTGSMARSVSMTGSVLGDATPQIREQDGVPSRKQPLLRFRRTDTPLPKEGASVPHMRRQGTFVRPPMPNRSSTQTSLLGRSTSGIMGDRPPCHVYTPISESMPYSTQDSGLLGSTPSTGLLGSTPPGLSMPPGLSAPPGLERSTSEDPPRTISLSQLLSRQNSNTGATRSSMGTNPGAKAPGMAQGPDGTGGFRLRRTNSNFSAILESQESAAILSSA